MTEERTTFVVTYCASDSAIFLLDFESVLMPNGEIIVFVFHLKYIIMTAMKVDTNIIDHITTSPTGRVVILVIMYVETVKRGVIAFIGSIILTNNFHCQTKYLNTDFCFICQ